MHSLYAIAGTHTVASACKLASTKTCMRFVSYILRLIYNAIFVLLIFTHIFLFDYTDSAFKQQRLPAWQPILTAGTVLPTFFVIGIAFIPVGVGLLWFSDEVKEIVVDYTYCNRSIPQADGSYIQTGTTCAEIIKQNSSEECICKINFTLDTDFRVR